MTVDGVFAGQLTVTNIVGGSARWAQVGYWVDRRYAGQGVIPTAVAMVVDYCLLELHLHRIEVAIRPENAASLRVVEKLGLHRDRVRAAATCTSTATGATTGCSRSPREDVAGGMLRRYKGAPPPSPGPQADPGPGAPRRRVWCRR